MRRVAVEADGSTSDYVEAVMKPGLTTSVELGHRQTVASLLHDGRLAARHPRPSVSADQEYAAFLRDTLTMDALDYEHSSIMDQYDPQKEIAASFGR